MGVAAFFSRDGADIEDEVEAFRGTTEEERGRILEALCRMAAEQIAQHPDPRRAFDWKDPLSPESEAALARLRARFRHG